MLSWLRHDANFRPVGIIFNKKEQTPYIASIGKVEFRATLPNKCHGIILILELYEKYKDAMHFAVCLEYELDSVN